MIQELFEKDIFIYVALGLCITGVLIKIIVAFIYGNLIRASNHMGNSQNKLMKLIRLKFETCYKLKIGVNNVDTFVDKYVYRHRFCGILLYTWENLGGQVTILCLLTGSVSSVLGLVYECGRRDILSTFFAGLFTSGLLISLDYFINLYVKRRVLKINIKEYLENFLKARLENEEFTPELIEEYRNEYFKKVSDDKNKQTVKTVKAEGSKRHNELKDESAATQVKEKPEETETVELIEIEDSPKISAISNSRNVAKFNSKTSSAKKDKKTMTSLEISKKEEKLIEEILREYII